MSRAIGAWSRVLAWLWVLLLLLAGLPFLALGLLIPPIAHVPTVIAWAVLLAISVRLAIGGSTRTWIPLIIAIALLFSVPSVGEALFGWTA